MCLLNKPKVTVLVSGRARVGPLPVRFRSARTSPSPRPASLAARDGLPPVSIVLAPSGPCCLCHCFCSSPSSHLFSDVTFSRMPSLAAPSKTACSRTHTHTPTHPPLFSIPTALFISLLSPHYCLRIAFLLVCVSLESRVLVLFIAVSSSSRTMPSP